MISLQQTLFLMVKNESISPKIRNKTRMPTLITFIQHSFGSPSHSSREEKEIKRIQIGKEVKLLLFAKLHDAVPRKSQRHY